MAKGFQVIASILLLVGFIFSIYLGVSMGTISDEYESYLASSIYTSSKVFSGNKTDFNVVAMFVGFVAFGFCSCVLFGLSKIITILEDGKQEEPETVKLVVKEYAESEEPAEEVQDTSGVLNE